MSARSGTRIVMPCRAVATDIAMPGSETVHADVAPADPAPA
jgi:hypothetical protein